MLTFRDAAKRYGVSHSSISRACEKHGIKTTNVGRCKLLTEAQAKRVAALIERRANSPAPQPAKAKQ